MFVVLQDVVGSDGCVETVRFCICHGEHSAEQSALSRLGFHLLLTGCLYFVVSQCGGESCLVLFLMHFVKFCEVRVQHVISKGSFRCTRCVCPKEGC